LEAQAGRVSSPPAVWRTAGRLQRRGFAPAAVTRAVDLAKRAGADEVREWVGLAALDAIDLGELLGVLVGELKAG
jgi:hypothetical protein